MCNIKYYIDETAAYFGKMLGEKQPNTPLEKYRDLLPDRWKSSNSIYLISSYCFLNYAKYKCGVAYNIIAFFTL